MAEPTPATPSTADPDHRYDVAVLGDHLSCGLLAAVLARQGLSVLLAGSGEDGEEAAGETTVPYTAEVFTLLARRYGVPEIAGFGLTSGLPAEVRRTSGVKRSLSFLYHHPGVEQRPQEAVQFNVPGEHTEWHVYRPSADLYARSIALRHGVAAVPDRALPVDVRVADDGVEIDAAGQTYRAEYVVDGSGPRSPLLARLGPALGGDQRLRHRSRAISTHMRGVRPYERTVPKAAYPRASEFSLGTLHHICRDGWLQVVPFGNHPDSVNPLCSVTLSVEPGAFPRELPAEEVFRRLIGRFPSVARQFEGAEAVRPWSDAPCGQRLVGPAAGRRYFLFERTAARNDMFLSRDITTGVETVHCLAAALIRAAREKDWDSVELEQAAAFQERLTLFNDTILAAARGACASFPLWNAFSRVWLLWQILAALSLKQARNACLAGGAGGSWTEVEHYADGGLWFPAPRGLEALMDDSFEDCVRVRDGRTDPDEAAGRIFGRLRAAPLVPPLYRFASPRARYYYFTLPRRLRTLLWTKTTAPPEFRHMLTKENISAAPPAVE